MKYVAFLGHVAALWTWALCSGVYFTYHALVEGFDTALRELNQ